MRNERWWNVLVDVKCTMRNAIPTIVGEKCYLVINTSWCGILVDEIYQLKKYRDYSVRVHRNFSSSCPEMDTLKSVLWHALNRLSSENTIYILNQILLERRALQAIKNTWCLQVFCKRLKLKNQSICEALIDMGHCANWLLNDIQLVYWKNSVWKEDIFIWGIS